MVFPVDLVVACARRDIAPELAGVVSAELAAEPECSHVLFPLVKRLCGRAILLVLKYILEDVAEICVARHPDRLHEGQRRTVFVAAEFLAGGVDIAPRAGISVARLQHSFLHADEPAHQLENRPGRVACLNRTVEQRLAGVGTEPCIIAAHVCQVLHVDAGAGDKREDLSGRGLDRNQRPAAALHELLPVLLQVGVDGSLYVFAGDGELVVGSVVVAGKHTVARIAQIDVVALLAPKFGLTCGLKPRASDIVAHAVFGVPADIVGVHLGHVAQQIASGVEGIVALRADTAVEAGETVLHLREAHICLLLDMPGEYQRLETDPTPVGAVVVHLLTDEVGVQPKRAGKSKSVERGDFARRHHYVVGGLVAYEHLPVPVVDHASRRIDRFIDYGVVEGIGLVLAVDDLDIEKPPQQHCRRDSKTYSDLDIFAAVLHAICSL